MKTPKKSLDPMAILRRSARRLNKNCDAVFADGSSHPSVYNRLPSDTSATTTGDSGVNDAAVNQQSATSSPEVKNKSNLMITSSMKNSEKSLQATDSTGDSSWKKPVQLKSKKKKDNVLPTRDKSPAKYGNSSCKNDFPISAKWNVPPKKSYTKTPASNSRKQFLKTESEPVSMPKIPLNNSKTVIKKVLFADSSETSPEDDEGKTKKRKKKGDKVSLLNKKTKKEKYIKDNKHIKATENSLSKNSDMGPSKETQNGTCTGHTDPKESSQALKVSEDKTECSSQISPSLMTGIPVREEISHKDSNCTPLVSEALPEKTYEPDVLPRTPDHPGSAEHLSLNLSNSQLDDSYMSQINPFLSVTLKEKNAEDSQNTLNSHYTDIVGNYLGTNTAELESDYCKTMERLITRNNCLLSEFSTKNITQSVKSETIKSSPPWTDKVVDDVAPENCLSFNTLVPEDNHDCLFSDSNKGEDVCLFEVSVQEHQYGSLFDSRSSDKIISPSDTKTTCEVVHYIMSDKPALTYNDVENSVARIEKFDSLPSDPSNFLYSNNLNKFTCSSEISNLTDSSNVETNVERNIGTILESKNKESERKSKRLNLKSKKFVLKNKKESIKGLTKNLKKCNKKIKSHINPISDLDDNAIVIKKEVDNEHQSSEDKSTKKLQRKGSCEVTDVSDSSDDFKLLNRKKRRSRISFIDSSDSEEEGIDAQKDSSLWTNEVIVEKGKKEAKAQDSSLEEEEARSSIFHKNTTVIPLMSTNNLKQIGKSVSSSDISAEAKQKNKKIKSKEVEGTGTRNIYTEEKTQIQDDQVVNRVCSKIPLSSKNVRKTNEDVESKDSSGLSAILLKSKVNDPLNIINGESSQSSTNDNSNSEENVNSNVISSRQKSITHSSKVSSLKGNPPFEGKTYNKKNDNLLNEEMEQLNEITDKGFLEIIKTNNYKEKVLSDGPKESNSSSEIPEDVEKLNIESIKSALEFQEKKKSLSSSICDEHVEVRQKIVKRTNSSNCNSLKLVKRQRRDNIKISPYLHNGREISSQSERKQKSLMRKKNSLLKAENKQFLRNKILSRDTKIRKQNILIRKLRSNSIKDVKVASKKLIHNDLKTKNKVLYSEEEIDNSSSISPDSVTPNDLESDNSNFSSTSEKGPVQKMSPIPEKYPSLVDEGTTNGKSHEDTLIINKRANYDLFDKSSTLFVSPSYSDENISCKKYFGLKDSAKDPFISDAWKSKEEGISSSQTAFLSKVNHDEVDSKDKIEVSNSLNESKNDIKSNVSNELVDDLIYSDDDEDTSPAFSPVQNSSSENSSPGGQSEELSTEENENVNPQVNYSADYSDSNNDTNPDELKVYEHTPSPPINNLPSSPEISASKTRKVLKNIELPKFQKLTPEVPSALRDNLKKSKSSEKHHKLHNTVQKKDKDVPLKYSKNLHNSKSTFIHTKGQVSVDPSELLPTDIPIVEVYYKEGPIYGILGEVDDCDYLTIIKARKCKLNSVNRLKDDSSSIDILRKVLRPLCRDTLKYNFCKKKLVCSKKHQFRNDSLNHLPMSDVIYVLKFVLRISDTVSESFMAAVLTYLGLYKAKNKIFKLSSHIVSVRLIDINYFKNLSGYLFDALQACGFEKWRAIKEVIIHNIALIKSWNSERISSILALWNVADIEHTLSIVDPLLQLPNLVLEPSILAKVIGEILISKISDKRNIYRRVAHQLLKLPIVKLNELSNRLISDFLRKLSEENLIKEENLLREKVCDYNATSFSSELNSINPPVSPLSGGCNIKRSKSFSDLRDPLLKRSIDTDFLVEPLKVYEEQKSIAAITRALECSNYSSVASSFLAASQKYFFPSVLSFLFKYFLDRFPFTMLNKLLKSAHEIKQFEEDKQHFGSLIASYILFFSANFKWSDANQFYLLFDKYNINAYKVESVVDKTMTRIRIAVTYSEVHFYNERYKESIGVLISLKLLNNPDDWLIPSDTIEDLQRVDMMKKFLMTELINLKIIDIATMFFKRLLEAQPSFFSPLDLRAYFEPLLYLLFESVDSYPETAVKLYLRVANKGEEVSINGLTARALLILMYRAHQTAAVSELFRIGVEEYVYPIFEENERTIFLLKSFSEEEMYVYISEWICWFKKKLEKNGLGTAGHEINVKFKSILLEEFLENKDLGIPSILREVDQSQAAAMKRLEKTLIKCRLEIRKVRSDTVIIDHKSLKAILNMAKIQ